MRILQLAPLWETVPPPAYGGTETVVSVLTEELVRAGHDVVLAAAQPNLTMGNAVAPPGTSPPGTDLTYTLTMTNNGGDNATSVVVVDTLAPTVQFKVGSVANTLPAGVTVVVAYSNDFGATWTYLPASGACSAPASYDRCVNRVRWTFQNPFSPTAPNNTATLKFTAQIR